VKLKTYEARLYNQWVRLLLDSGERNVTGFSDAWAETRYVEVQAESLECAARLLSRDYPAEVGFVVRPCGRIDSGIGLRIPRRNPV
jgi:hypothetical protein